MTTRVVATARRRTRSVASSPSRRGHPDVHEDDVGVQFAGERGRLVAVASVTDNSDVGVALEDQREPGVMVADWRWAAAVVADLDLEPIAGVAQYDLGVGG